MAFNLSLEPLTGATECLQVFISHQGFIKKQMLEKNKEERKRKSNQ